MKSKSVRRDKKEAPAFQIHPHKAMLNMGLMGISSLFIGFTVAYLFSSNQTWSWADFSFPKLFLVSTILLVISSFTINKAVKAYKNSQEQELKKWFIATAVLSLGFVLTQVLGWMELTAEGVRLNGKPDGSYLYVISGMHALHVLAGVIPLVYFMLLTFKKLADPVHSLIFFTDEGYKTKFEILERYWHFVDLLWIYLLFFFLFNHL